MNTTPVIIGLLILLVIVFGFSFKIYPPINSIPVTKDCYGNVSYDNEIGPDMNWGCVYRTGNCKEQWFGICVVQR